jgi:hypothetical protein
MGKGKELVDRIPSKKELSKDMEKILNGQIQ